MDRMDAMDKMDEGTRHASPLKPPPSRRHASPWDRRRPGGMLLPGTAAVPAAKTPPHVFRPLARRAFLAAKRQKR